MGQKSLFETVNEVHDEASFLAFLGTLENDRRNYLQHTISGDWQNETIEDFLESAQRWGKTSINGLQFYDKPDNPWKRCAQILYMGKIYE